MSITHDIYDPPPAPVPWDPPKAERLVFTTGDLACLALLCAGFFASAVAFWSADPSMAVFTALGGTLVILESWFTALGFLHRRKSLGLRARWTVFIAALLPWVVGLGIAAALMLGMFLVSDRIG